MPIPHSLLGLLSQQPASASELRRRFHAATGETWKLNQGQVSQTLARLQRDGLIESKGHSTNDSGHTAETFALTERGRAEVAKWWLDPVLQRYEDRDELVIKFSIAAQTQPDVLASLVLAQREAIMAALRDTVQHKATLDRNDPRYLVAERRIFNLEAESRWLDRIEQLKEF